jgi:hypothetical protein
MSFKHFLARTHATDAYVRCFFFFHECRQMGLDMDSSSSNGQQQAANPEEALAALKPPRPIELVAQPETSVVVITGTLAVRCAYLRG